MSELVAYEQEHTLSDKVNLPRATAYLMSNMSNEITEGFAREHDIKRLKEELEDRDSIIYVYKTALDAVNRTNNMDQEMQKKVKEHLISKQRYKLNDSLQKLDIQIKSLLSRREDIINQLTNLDKGILNED